MPFDRPVAKTLAASFYICCSPNILSELQVSNPQIVVVAEHTLVYFHLALVMSLLICCSIALAFALNLVTLLSPPLLI